MGQNAAVFLEDSIVLTFVYGYPIQQGPHTPGDTYPDVPDCAAKHVGNESGNQIQEAQGCLEIY